MRAKGTWVALFFVGAALLVAFVLHLALSSLFLTLHIGNAPILGPRFPLSALLAATISFLTAVYLGIFYKPSRDFVEQCVVELDKVAWPTWSDTKISTMIVIVTSLVSAVILGMFDVVFSWLTNHNLFLR